MVEVKNAPSLTLPLEGEGSSIAAGGGDSLHRMGKATYFTSTALSNAKRLRREMTEVEKKLWWQLRRKNMAGFKFRKQVSIGNYIADFVCMNPKLIIELDGGQHADQQEYDQKRDSFFKNQGFRILRFWNNDVFTNMEGVLQVILSILATPLPNPLPQGERE